MGWRIHKPRGCTHLEPAPLQDRVPGNQAEVSSLKTPGPFSEPLWASCLGPVCAMVLLLGLSGGRAGLLTRGVDAARTHWQLICVCEWSPWWCGDWARIRGEREWGCEPEARMGTDSPCMVAFWNSEESKNTEFYQPWTFSLLWRPICWGRRILHVSLNSLFTWYAINLQL